MAVMDLSTLSLDNISAAGSPPGESPNNPLSLPEMLSSKKKASDISHYRVRYKKFNLDDPGDVIELEHIETRAIQNKGVFIWSKKDFIFMDKLFMLIQYIETDQDQNN